MRHLCTVFDKNFLLRGLALYESCARHYRDDFTLWIVCLDDELKTLLERASLPHAVLLRVEDLNDQELLAVRATRTVSEFSWTCKSSLLLYLMGKIGEGETILWLDADQFLFADPEPLYRHLAAASIAITPHRFSPPDTEKENRLGVYNAGWIYMKKDTNALACLTHWRAQCIEWCFNRKERNRYGDQIYLNEWPRLYMGVHALDWPGVNAGPWNLANKRVAANAGSLNIDGSPLLFFHFHGLRFYIDAKNRIVSYPISIGNELIYRRYLAALQRELDRFQACNPNYVFHTDAPLGALRRLKQRLSKIFS